MPCELRFQRLWMEDDHFSLGGADGQAHAEAELMHTINQALQPMIRIALRKAGPSVL